MTITLPLVACLTLVFPLLAIALAGPIAERTEPRTATWLLTAAAVALAVSSGAALALVALAAAIRLPFVAAKGHWSPAVIERGDPTGIVTAVICGLLLSAALAAVARFALRRGRALAEAFDHARDLPGRGPIVVTGDTSADAYTVPGWPGRIVVSAGMLENLDDAGRAALLAHERAHLVCRHYVFTTVTRLAAVANPLLHPLADAVEYTVERWADEHAAQAVGDRRLVAETIARAAVAAKRSEPRRSPIVALGAVFDLAGARLAVVLDVARARAGALSAIALDLADRSPRIGGSLRANRSRSTDRSLSANRSPGADGSPGTDRSPRAITPSLAAAGPVPRRVAALLKPPPGRRLILQALIIAVMLVAVLSTVDAARHLRELIEIAEARY